MLLSVQDINVYYGAIHAVKGVSFEVEEGEIVTLIGANGAGKSTTLQTVSGLLRSKTGSITFLGENISGVSAAKQHHCPRSGAGVRAVPPAEGAPPPGGGHPFRR